MKVKIREEEKLFIHKEFIENFEEIKKDTESILETKTFEELYELAYEGNLVEGLDTVKNALIGLISLCVVSEKTDFFEESKEENNEEKTN